jgi:predicted CXXCH cytochrome family protein
MNVMIRNVLLYLIVLLLLCFTAGAHGENSNDPSQLMSPREALREELSTLEITPGASCVSNSCHDDLTKKKFIHSIGVDGMKCDRCHEMADEKKHRFKKIPEVTRDLCQQCHSTKIIAPTGLDKTPPKVISIEKAKELHTPFAEGKCTACHDAHSSNYYKHLKLAYPEGIYASYKISAYALCVSCHKKLDEVMTEPRTLTLTMFRNGNANQHFRHVNKVKGRTCSVCHHPHGLEQQGLIKDAFRFGNRMLTVDFEKTDSGGRCTTTCHREATYDRYKPASNFIKTEPLPGEDASEEELEESRKVDMQKLKEEEKTQGEKDLSPGNQEEEQ